MVVVAFVCGVDVVLCWLEAYFSYRVLLLPTVPALTCLCRLSLPPQGGGCWLLLPFFVRPSKVASSAVALIATSVGTIIPPKNE